MPWSAMISREDDVVNSVGLKGSWSAMISRVDDVVNSVGIKGCQCSFGWSSLTPTGPVVNVYHVEKRLRCSIMLDSVV